MRQILRPAIGRFVNENPAGFFGGDANFYAYVSNNSANFVDQLGLCDTAPQSGTVMRVGPGSASAVGPKQAKYTGQSGSLYSTTDSHSIPGGMETVAVPHGFLGLSKAKLRQY